MEKRKTKSKGKSTPKAKNGSGAAPRTAARSEAPPGSTGDYVRRVQQSTTDYVKDVLHENDKLRGLVHALQSELDRHKRERLRLEEQLSTIEAECKRYLNRYVDVELQNANVANLYVALLRLHSTLSRKDVISAIQEIVINLVGSEELAIFELPESNGSRCLRLVASFGVEARPLAAVPLGAGIIGCTAERGEIHVAGTPKTEAAPYESHLTACVPLMVDGRVTGAVAIFRLLSHKRSLQEVDYELFSLIGTQGAMALYCSGLREGAS